MSLTSLFCSVDDFCINFEPEWHKQIIGQNIKPVISKTLSMSEVMTLVIHFHQSAYRDFKHYYTGHVQKFLASEFPGLVSYNRFVELMPKALVPLTIFLKTRCMGKATGLSLIDSTPLVVCNNLRIDSHRVFSGMAKRGRTSTGWKFGFKLHLVKYPDDCFHIIMVSGFFHPSRNNAGSVACYVPRVVTQQGWKKTPSEYMKAIIRVLIIKFISYVSCRLLCG